jgi:hypothetical protein
MMITIRRRRRRMMTAVRSWEEKEGERGAQTSDLLLSPPLGQGRKGGPHNCNAEEG